MPAARITGAIHRPDHIESQVSRLRDLMRSKRYSPSTVSTYTEALRIFLRFCGPKDIEDLDENDLVQFNNQYILRNGLSSSYQNQVVNAVKLFFSEIRNKKMLPEMIHRQVKMLLESPVNI